MMGGHDPDCRRPFDWNYSQDSVKVSLRNHYKKLIQIRKEYSSLRTGAFKTLIADDMVYGFERSDSESTIKVILNKWLIQENLKSLRRDVYIQEVIFIIYKTYIIDWNNYNNSLLLSNQDGYRRVSLELYKRIDI